jgi:hypothetical protein
MLLIINWNKTCAVPDLDRLKLRSNFLEPEKSLIEPTHMKVDVFDFNSYFINKSLKILIIT